MTEEVYFSFYELLMNSESTRGWWLLHQAVRSGASVWLRAEVTVLAAQVSSFIVWSQAPNSALMVPGVSLVSNRII